MGLIYFEGKITIDPNKTGRPPEFSKMINLAP